MTMDESAGKTHVRPVEPSLLTCPKCKAVFRPEDTHCPNPGCPEGRTGDDPPFLMFLERKWKA